MVDEIWNGFGIPCHISNPKWPSSSVQLVDGNLTEVLCFYVAHRGRYGNHMVFTSAGLDLCSLLWFFYITLVCMALLDTNLGMKTMLDFLLKSPWIISARSIILKNTGK